MYHAVQTPLFKGQLWLPGGSVKLNAGPNFRHIGASGSYCAVESCSQILGCTVLSLCSFTQAFTRLWHDNHSGFCFRSAFDSKESFPGTSSSSGHRICISWLWAVWSVLCTYPWNSLWSWSWTGSREIWRCAWPGMGHRSHGWCLWMVFNLHNTMESGQKGYFLQKQGQKCRKVSCVGTVLDAQWVPRTPGLGRTSESHTAQLPMMHVLWGFPREAVYLMPQEPGVQSLSHTPSVLLSKHPPTICHCSRS